MRRLLLLFSLAAAPFLIVGKASALPQDRALPPVFFWPMVFVEDFIHPELSSETTRTLSSAWKYAGVDPDVFVGAQVLESYRQAGLDPAQFLGDLNVLVGYYGETRTGPYPVISEYLDQRGERCGVLTEGMDWNTAYLAVEQRYSSLLDPLAGDALPGTIGGPSLVAQEAGRELTVIHTNHWECAPAGPALRSLPGVAPDAVEIGPFPGWYARTGRPEAGSSLQRLFAREVMWYQGVLNFTPDDRHQGPGNANQLVGNRPHIVAMPVMESRTYALADIWAWAYDNPQWGCEPPTLEEAQLSGVFLRQEEEREGYFLDYAVGLAQGVSQHINRFPRSRSMTASDLNAIIRPGYGMEVPFGTVDELARQLSDPNRWLDDTYGQGVRRPPLHLEANGDFYALADAFSLLRRAIVLEATGDFAESLPLIFVRGPKDSPHPGLEVITDGIAIPAQDIVDACVALGAVPLEWLPARIAVGPRDANTAEMLWLMANWWRQVRTGTPPGTVAAQASRLCSYGQTILEETFTPRQPLPLFLSSMQVWTMKPASFRDFSQRKDTPPRIVMAGYGWTDATEEDGGRIEAIAWGLDPDGEALPGIALGDLGIVLQDEGTRGDYTPFDGIFGLIDWIGPGLGAGSYLSTMQSIDSVGNLTPPWPYLTIGQNARPYRFQSVAPPIPAPSWQEQYRRALLPPLESFDYNASPVIVAAGYSQSTVTAAGGGQVEIAAALYEPQGLFTIEDVRVFYEGFDLQISLTDTGGQRDGQAEDGIFGAVVSLPPIETAPGEYLLTIVAFDEDGNASLPWPYLTIPRRRQ